ncbi:hypothetical protein BDV93DRAFT_238459 [Ceratobasidium sp. AG-I]|nr:hypothetical protein BDV93DRAFT_238459 [Ceratobasidium sp. AG-I]
MARQNASFEDKRLDVSLLESPKLEMLKGDLDDVRLGLSEGVYQRIQAGVTVIIHVRFIRGECTVNESKYSQLECMGSQFQLQPPGLRA